MTELVDVAPVSEKGQVTIPKEVRVTLGLKPGDRLAFVSTESGIVVKKAKTRKLSEILSKQKAIGVPSLAFQRRSRAQWNSL
jgi:AbrB family looped-hinge helix DNA binding protein